MAIQTTMRMSAHVVVPNGSVADPDMRTNAHSGQIKISAQTVMIAVDPLQVVGINQGSLTGYLKLQDNGNTNE